MCCDPGMPRRRTADLPVQSTALLSGSLSVDGMVLIEICNNQTNKSMRKVEPVARSYISKLAEFASPHVGAGLGV